jgi:hypothetical protein
MSEQFQTGSKKPGRGMAQGSLNLIAAMRNIAEAAQPITGRGIGYKLFTAGLISSMSVNDMQKVYRLLRIAREQGDIPWGWIVDETRELERVSTWSDPASTRGRSRHPIVATSGISSRTASRSGLRRVPYSAC